MYIRLSRQRTAGKRLAAAAAKHGKTRDTMRGTSRAREVGKMATQTDLDQSTVDGIPAGILGIPPPTLHRRGEAGKRMNVWTVHSEEKASVV